MASNKADCVLGGVLLISSANKILVKTGPLLNWKKRFPGVGTRKVVARLGKNGILTTTNKTTPIKSTTSFHEITVTLDNKMHKNLVGLAAYEVRTVSDQVKYLVHREMERVERNSKNIPF